MATKLFPIYSPYSARPAFGENNKVQNARDYINDKSTRLIFCNAKYCDPIKKINVSSQGDLLLLKKTKYLNYYKSLYDKNNSNYISKTVPNYIFNKTNLNVNLISKLDLKNVEVISNNLTGQNPTPIILRPSNNIPYYNNYKIDPNGILFGNTPCGINNYENFMVFNPPYVSSNSENYINSL